MRPAADGASSTGRIADDGLLDLDVTEAHQLLARSEPPLWFTAFVVASVACAARFGADLRHLIEKTTVLRAA